MLQPLHPSKFILVILIIISGILGLLRFNSLQIGTSYDDAHYIILAESLSSGQGYQLINFPRPQMERAFPPGWPILMTPFALLFPHNYTILKLFSLVLWLASLTLIYKLFSQRIESPYLEILIGLIALNPLLVGMSVTVMSESAYVFFSLLGLVLFDSWNSEAVPIKAWQVILIAVIALYAQLIRTVGISLSIALISYFLLTRRFREAFITFGVFVTGMLLQAWLNLRNGGSIISVGYESQIFNGSILEKLGQMWANLLGYLNEILASSLIPSFGEKVNSLFGPIIPLLANVVIILLIIWGLVLSSKKFHLSDIYVLIYLLGILAFWNPRVGSVKARFLIPMLPFLYFYLIQGIRWCISKLTRDNLTVSVRIIKTIAGIIALLLLGRNLQDWRNPVRNQMTDLSIGNEWISQNTVADTIVMVNEPVPAYLHVQRKTINYPNDMQDLQKYLDNQGIDYIIVSPLLQSPRTTDLDKYAEAQLLPFLESNLDVFEIVYSNPEYNVTVYRYDHK